MKRTDITELFPDATPEQIDKLMNLNGADINTAKKGVESLQTQLAELQGKLDTPSDELKEAKNQAKALQAEINRMKAEEAVRAMRQKVSEEQGVPARLLTGSTEEECGTQAQEILAFVKQNNGYPNVRDAGETHIETRKDTRDQFAEWFNNL